MTMNMRRHWPLLAGLALMLAGAALFLVGCGASSGGGSAAQSSARAAASKLAQDPAVQAAEGKWKPVVTSCAQQQHWVFHPFKSAKGTVTCAASGLSTAQRKAAEQCAVQAVIANGVGRGKLHEDIDSIARCMAKAAPKGPGK
jgi:hypothetical protein